MKFIMPIPIKCLRNNIFNHLLFNHYCGGIFNKTKMIIPTKISFCCVFCLTIFNISGIKASVLKDELEEHSKDLALDEGVESIKHDKQKGDKNHQIESIIKDSHINQHTKASDDGKFVKKVHDSKKTLDNDAYTGYNSKQDKSEDNETSGFKRGHKKGHHKQGFQNSYHKDESSNKSTFFDDFNDENDRSVYNAKTNTHDNHGGRSYKGGHNNGHEYIRDNFDSRGHNRYRDNGNKQTDYRDYAKKHYLDDYENYNKRHNNHGTHRRDNIRNRHEYQEPQRHQDYGWDQNRWHERNQWSRPDGDIHQGWSEDYGGPGYYDDRGLRHEGGYGYGPNHGYGYEESQAKPVAQLYPNPPVIAQRKQTITIYEDPRYDDANEGQFRREEGDYLHLDFQPSRQRYARYDDSYYNTPSRERTMEASRINRLVYNYGRN